MTNLLGLHCGENWQDTAQLGYGGSWRVIPVAVGHDPDDHSGHDYTALKDAGQMVVVRLQHGWDGGGCIPTTDLYPQFAQRSANYVAASVGIDYVVIGNEMNHGQEWPAGQAIYAEDYADCFNLCYEAIRWTGSSVQVCIGAVAPYNAEMGDWIDYYADILADVIEYDAIAIHAYSRGQEPEAITDPSRMDPPFEKHYNGFQVYREWIKFGIGPYLLTEFNPINDPAGWQDRSTHLIWEALTEIDMWNANADLHGKPILCVCVYGTNPDVWDISDKANVVSDYKVAADKPIPSPIDDEEEPPVTTIIDGFEDGFHWFGGDGHLEIPNDWGVAWVPGDKPGPVRPECKYELRGRDQGVRTGDYGSKIAHSYAFFDAALYRSFAVPRGAEVTASVWTTAESGGLLACQVGIDPHGAGGGDFQDEAVVWGEWWGTANDGFESYDWRQVSSVAVAESDQITVFLRCKCDDPVQTNAGFFDDFSLTFEGDAPQPPEPPTPPPSGDHVLRVYLDDVLISEEPFTAQASGVTFAKAG